MKQVKLTVRQEEVFRLIAAGKSNSQISEELSISWDSVKSHVAKIYLKIGIHRRAAAIGWWLANREEG